MSHLKTKTTAELLAIYSAKAPVNVPGAQYTVAIARAILKGRGVVFPSQISTALSHALHVGEGREEFDREMGAWRHRGDKGPYTIVKILGPGLTSLMRSGHRRTRMHSAGKTRKAWTCAQCRVAFEKGTIAYSDITNGQHRYERMCVVCIEGRP